MGQEARVYGLNMLPMYLMMGKEQIRSSETQLQNLEVCKNQSYTLDDCVVNNIIQMNTEQNEVFYVPIEQCRKWREQSPNEEQLSEILEVENIFKYLIEINEKILVLARWLKKETADNVIRTKDMEIILSNMGYSINS